MRSDPCRRATFGVTIENTNARFWYTWAFLLIPNSRNKSWFTFSVHLRLRVTTTSGGTRQYREYLVCQTTRVISDFGADSLRGHGTRVFEAQVMSQNGQSIQDAEPIVLKDTWRGCDRGREDQILEQILSDRSCSRRCESGWEDR